MPENINPNCFLRGSLVNLRPVETTDAPLLQKWSNDPDLRALIGEVMPSSSKDIDTYIEKISSSADRVWFMIEIKETGQAIGEAGLLRMFPPWRTTDLSIILGEENGRGQGYGTEAIRLLLDYAFGTLNYHRVSIGVVGFNEIALKFYEKIGFKREGIQRDGYFFNYHFSDFVMLSILDNEFYETKHSK